VHERNSGGVKLTAERKFMLHKFMLYVVCRLSYFY